MSSLPTSFKLDQFWRDLVNPNGQKVLQILSHSYFSEFTTPRMMEGMRRKLGLRVNGAFVTVSNGASNFAYCSRSGGTLDAAFANHGDTIATPCGSKYGGLDGPEVLTDLVSKFPVRLAEIVVTNSAGLAVEFGLLPANTQDMMGRTWFGFDNVQALTARLVYIQHARMLPQFNLVARRGNARGAATNATVQSRTITKPGGPSGRITGEDVNCGTGPYAQYGVTVRCEAFGAASAGSADAFPVLGCRFKTDEATGVQLQNFSESGFTTGDHIGQIAWDDSAVADFYSTVGIPTHILHWRGQNANQPTDPGLSEAGANGLDAGAGANYKANEIAVMQRHDAIIAGLGAPPPLHLFCGQHKTGYTSTFHETQAQALYEIAQAYPRACFLNIYRLSGAMNFDNNTDGLGYVASGDAVHHNADGDDFCVGLLGVEAARAMAAGSGSTLGIPVGID